MTTTTTTTTTAKPPLIYFDHSTPNGAPPRLVVADHDDPTTILAESPATFAFRHQFPTVYEHWNAVAEHFDPPGTIARIRNGHPTRYLLYAHGAGRLVDIDNRFTTSDHWGALQKAFAARARAGRVTRLSPEMINGIGDYAQAFPLYSHAVTPAGLHYHEELAGPDGMSFLIFRFPTTPAELVEDSRRWIKQTRDAVRISVLRIDRML